MLSVDSGYIKLQMLDKNPGPRLAIVIPCFNEEQIVWQTAAVLTDKVAGMIASGLISSNSLICFVDDGSKDGTWSEIKKLCLAYQNIEGLGLAGNAGHQKALLAGMLHIRDRVDCCITMDADLQDDPDVLPEFVERHRQGAEIVFGVRKDRRSDTFGKRYFAQQFYKFQRSLGISVISNHADFRLLSAKALAALGQYTERNVFLRGIVCSLGMRTSIVYYQRKARIGGRPKYNLSRMIALALDGITSFSIRPLRFVAVLGGIVTAGAFVLAMYVLLEYLRGAMLVEGWTSLAILMLFLGGVQIMSLGIVGEYIGKIYVETKRRPHYQIGEIIQAKVGA